MNFTKETILNILRKEQPQIKKWGVKKIGLFGSYLTNTQTDESDIDLLIDFQPEMYSYDNFINVCYLFDNLFVGKKVEVVTIKSLSPFIGPKILKKVEYVF